jgi:hypothetical protein
MSFPVNVKKKGTPTDEPTRKPVRVKGWVGYALLKHALPTEHLTIESRMNEQKKRTPTDQSRSQESQ